MAIPKKGSRTIVIDGETYRWLIRRKPPRCQVECDDGKLSVAVEHAEVKGSVLVIETNIPHPQGLGGLYNPIGVRPSDMKRWINEAVESGWQPEKPGKQFTLKIGKQK
jgi:hypothetical protein